MLKAPAFLFPSYTVFIDDDTLYPHVITRDIPNCPPIAPRKDFDFILQQKDEDFLFLHDNAHKSSDEVFSILNNDVDNKDFSLHDLISVLIVDFNMEDSNGLDLLAQIKSPFIYKVLISNYIGPNNEEAVQQAQNVGIIDEFIEKGKPFNKALRKIIRRGQTKFFTRLSNQLFASRDGHKYLTDTNVAKKFLEMVDRFEPHTIWPEPDLASFTLSTKDSPSTVFFTNQSEIDALIACYDAVQIPIQTLQRIRHGDYIVCHKNPHSLDIEEWPYFLKPSHKIDGTNGPVLYHITGEGHVVSN